MCKSAQRNGLLLVSLLFSIPILAASEHRNHGSDYQITGLLKFLLNIPYRPWQNLLDKTQSNSKKSIEDYRETTYLSTLAEQKRSNNFELPSRTIESSIVKNEDLQVSHFRPFAVRENRQENGCACTPELVWGCNCVITCSAVGVQCGQTCTHVTVYTAEYLKGPAYEPPSLSTSVTIYNKNCNGNCLTKNTTTDVTTDNAIYVTINVTSEVTVTVNVPSDVTVNVPSNVPSDVTVNVPSDVTVNVPSDVTVNVPSDVTSDVNNDSNYVSNYVPLVAAVVGGMVAIALAVAIPLGINPPPVESNPPEPIADFSVIEDKTDKIPFNRQPFFENFEDFPPDGCGNNFGRMEIGNSNRNLDRNRPSEGNCQPLMRRGNCRSPQDWVTVNPTTLKGSCTPRLCGRGRVFVGRDGLCHDISGSGKCQGGRRLYYSPFGDPICDCPIGEYPFPNAENNCVALFTRGPCRDGSIVGISSQSQLECIPSKCRSTNVGDKSLQLLPAEDGQCYALGTQGPCSPPSLLGYDIFKRQMECVNVQNDTSPYFTSPEEEALVDSIYNQRSPDFNDFRISMVFKSPVGTNDIGQRRQGATTGGIFQFPSFSPETLLNPCRPGARWEMNYKCTNPLVPKSRTKRETLQAVRPAFQCTPDKNLQATGRCVTDNRSTNCGPSFRFNPVTGQCRSIF